MSWVRPIVCTPASKPRKSGAGVVLSKGQIEEVKKRLGRLKPYTNEKAAATRDLAREFRCDEGTIRRAQYR